MIDRRMRIEAVGVLLCLACGGRTTSAAEPAPADVARAEETRTEHHEPENDAGAENDAGWREALLHELGRPARPRPEQLAALRQLVERSARSMTAAERSFAERAITFRERVAQDEVNDADASATLLALFEEYADLYPDEAGVQCTIASVLVVARGAYSWPSDPIVARARALAERFPDSPCGPLLSGLMCRDLAVEEPAACMRHFLACAARDPDRETDCATRAAQMARDHTAPRCATAAVARTLSIATMTPVPDGDPPGAISHGEHTFTAGPTSLRARDVVEIRELGAPGTVGITLTAAARQRLSEENEERWESDWLAIRLGARILHAGPITDSTGAEEALVLSIPLERLCTRVTRPELPDDLRAPD